jgi:hypothetical protein
MNGPTLPPQAYTREILSSAFNWLQTQPESVRKLATSPDALVGLYLRAQRFGNSSLEADAPVSSQAFMSDLKNLAEGLKQFEGPANAESRRPMNAAPSANNSGIQGFNQASRPSPTAVRPTIGVFANGTQPAHQSTNQFAGQQAGTQQVTQQMTQPAGAVIASQPIQPELPASPQPSLQSQIQAALGFASETTSQNQATELSFAPNGASATANSGSNSVSQVYVQLQVPQSNAHAQAPLGLNDGSLNMIREVKAGLNLSSDVEAINMMIAIAYKNLKDLLA